MSKKMLIAVIFFAVIASVYSTIFVMSINQTPVNNSDILTNKTTGLCNTADLKPSDDAAKFIATIKCLDNQLYEINQRLEMAEQAATKAALAEDAANRAANAAEEVNSKLDRMFKKSMLR